MLSSVVIGLILSSNISILVDCQAEFPIGLALYYSCQEYDGDENLVWLYYHSFNITDRIDSHTYVIESYVNDSLDYSGEIIFPEQFLNHFELAQLWVDRTFWEVDQIVTINDFAYEIISDSYVWSGHIGPLVCYYLELRSGYGEVEEAIDLYYDVESGILVGYRNAVWNTNNLTEGFTNVGELLGHNLNIFTSFELGINNPLLIDSMGVLFIVGIAAEILIIVFLWKRKM